MSSGAAPRPTLALILARHAPAILSADAARVVRAIVACRTPALGGRREVCDHCGDVRDLYASCGNRHCPTCQGLAAERWLERQQASLLPVPYFHVVFTVPQVLHALFLGARRESYDLLLAAAAETLLDVARSRLSATPGVLVVLHTWSQLLTFHPHVHCLVTGGGLSEDQLAWVATRQNFLLPGRILRRVFAAKLRQKLSKAAEKGRLGHSLSTTRRLLWLSKQTPWVIHVKAPFAGPEQVLRYLGRYTHRTAISNPRILAFAQDEVTFAYRDRKHGNVRKHLSLNANAFVRRFLLHVLPKRFVRIRHFGVLANPVKVRLLPLCRRLLGAAQLEAPAHPRPWYELLQSLTGIDPRRCSQCQQGHYVMLCDLPRDPFVSTARSRSP